ncbi:MAG: adenosylcobinamide-phosphate synthase CbiB [Victivallales bacterium]|nr:adenosylcobinamide-phosphate synthase CbiB [Victivallales bacterium]
MALLLFGSWLLDLLCGDPRTPYHPVALTGRFALFLEPYCRKLTHREFPAGMWCSLAVVISATTLAGTVVIIAGWLGGKTATMIVSIILLYFTVAPRCLCDHVRAVEKRLAAGDLPGARRRIGWIVSRDPEALSVRGVIRSGVESLGENFSDGVTAAWFYAALGWLAGGPAGAAAAAWGYRAANTLDATFGYKNRRYRRFGTFPARCDDLLNFIPARLTVAAVIMAAALLRLRPLNTWKCAWRDHRKHPSPNSAWGMAAFAGALGVRLGAKPNTPRAGSNIPTGALRWNHCA